MYHPGKAGQGASEYMMIVGAALLVGLLAVTLLGMFARSSTDVPDTESQIYWAGYAKPFSVRDAVYRTNGTCSPYYQGIGGPHLLIKNTEKWPLNLTGVHVNGASLGFCLSGDASTLSTLSFKAGEEKTIGVADAASALCSNRTKASIGLAFQYSSPYLSGLVQSGTTQLAFPCS